MPRDIKLMPESASLGMLSMIWCIWLGFTIFAMHPHVLHGVAVFVELIALDEGHIGIPPGVVQLQVVICLPLQGLQLGLYGANGLCFAYLLFPPAAAQCGYLNARLGPLQIVLQG